MNLLLCDFQKDVVKSKTRSNSKNLVLQPLKDLDKIIILAIGHRNYICITSIQ